MKKTTKRTTRKTLAELRTIRVEIEESILRLLTNFPVTSCIDPIPINDWPMHCEQQLKFLKAKITALQQQGVEPQFAICERIEGVPLHPLVFLPKIAVEAYLSRLTFVMEEQLRILDSHKDALKIYRQSKKIC